MHVVTIEHMRLFLELGSRFTIHAYHIERLLRLDDQDYEPRISSNRFSPPDCVAQYELYFQFDWEKRKPNSLAYFFQ